MSEDEEPVAGPLDVDILDRIGQRLAGSDRFSTVAVQPESARDSVVAEFDLGFYPAAVERAYLQIRWFQTDDFSVHYLEAYASRETWECRWDRHPNDHNTRELPSTTGRTDSRNRCGVSKRLAGRADTRPEAAGRTHRVLLGLTSVALAGSACSPHSVFLGSTQQYNSGENRCTNASPFPSFESLTRFGGSN
jgi:hypothetical protein